MAAGLRRGGPGPGTMSFRYGPLRTLERAQERARKAEARRRAKREMSGLPPTAEEEVLDGVNQTAVVMLLVAPLSAIFAVGGAALFGAWLLADSLPARLGRKGKDGQTAPGQPSFASLEPQQN